MPGKLSALVSFRCPTCHEGELFPTGSFGFDRPFQQYSHCANCGQSYFPEPGFYYGAMFLSYIGSGFFCLGFVMLLHWVFDWSMTGSFAALIAIVAVFFVWWFRFSRSAYLHMIYGYKPERAAAARAGKLRVPTPEIVSGT